MTDYLPAVFDDEMAQYLAQFKAAMPAYAATFNIAGSFEADDISARYRSPVELGWKNRIKFDTISSAARCWNKRSLAREG